jgi:hypothetical protein
MDQRCDIFPESALSHPNRARDDALPVAAILDALDVQVGYPADVNLEIGLPKEKIVTDLFEPDIFSDNWRSCRSQLPTSHPREDYLFKCGR